MRWITLKNGDAFKVPEAVANEYEAMRDALIDIQEPLARMQRIAEADGAILNGSAYAIAHSPAYLQGIAAAAHPTPHRS
jgi:hypothetical protein